MLQTLCALPQPDHMIWHYPGVPSLLVTYMDVFAGAVTALLVGILAGTLAPSVDRVLALGC
ncbi:MAG TPA: hypothetical protein VKD91_17610 [Pyrinomonadaceae bacterium]|nr:hypothetical protein [Pyrinomonadaceae bacterium]